MTDAAPGSKQPKQRKRRSGSSATPAARGEVTFIDVPKPPASAFNKDRPVGCLLQAQLRHFHHAESGRLTTAKRDGRRPEEIRTEVEAADYIGKITKLLHPQRRRKPRPPASA